MSRSSRVCLASLSRFVGRLGEKALPLYQLMKKSDRFSWTPQADAAFYELKKMLATAPILASPLPREPMLLYIAATNRGSAEVGEVSGGAVLHRAVARGRRRGATEGAPTSYPAGEANFRATASRRRGTPRLPAIISCAYVRLPQAHVAGEAPAVRRAIVPAAPRTVVAGSDALLPVARAGVGIDMPRRHGHSQSER